MSNLNVAVLKFVNASNRPIGSHESLFYLQQEFQGGGDDSEDEEEILLACAAAGDDEEETKARAADLLVVIRNQLRLLSEPDSDATDASNSDPAALAAAVLLEEEQANPSSEVLLYVCQQCGEGLHNKTELGKHVITHARRRQRFGCKRCGQIFEGAAAKKDLIDHVKVDHMGKPAAQCPDCSRQFTFTSALKKHRYRRRCETAHSVRRLAAYGCSLCDKIFCAGRAETRFQQHWESCTGTVIRARPAEVPSLVESTNLFEDHRNITSGMTAREALALRREQQKLHQHQLRDQGSQQLQEEGKQQQQQQSHLVPFEEVDVANLDSETVAQLEHQLQLQAATTEDTQKSFEVDDVVKTTEHAEEDPDAWLAGVDNSQQ